MRLVVFNKSCVWIIASLFFVFSCATIPERALPVKPFEKEKYLGTWYEIARLDYKYEKDLNNVTATYSIQDNGTIKVENRGYNTRKMKWEEAIGKAKFVKDPTEARLKVSFFGPFYAGYNVIGLDVDYKYALVAGSSLDYLWILSRDTNLPNEVKEQFLKTAEGLGYKTSELIWVVHDKNR